MNIGIFVTSLAPKSASQSRLQTALFAGLKNLSAHKYHFIVFSHEVPTEYRDSEKMSYCLIDQESRGERASNVLKLMIARVLLFICNVLGAGGGRLGASMRRWMSPEPKYYKQLRKFNVRLLWNLNQHELRTSLPFIRTVWEANHRIHSMYPEYSYTRYTFDGCDSNMTDSLARASYVIVGTEEGKRQVTSMFGVHDSKVRVIPFPTPLLGTAGQCSASVRDTIAKSPYIFYPARFWPHKNHVVILAALKRLHKWDIKPRCIFSGADEGNLNYVLQYAEKLGVRDQVEYVGLVPEEDVPFLYQGAVALVFASAVGPDNLPPLEAMLLGCPVITAEVPGAREQYGDAALYFDPMSEQALASRVKELLVDRSLRETLIARGRERAAGWTVDDYAKSVVSILDEFSTIARAWERCDSAFT